MGAGLPQPLDVNSGQECNVGYNDLYEAGALTQGMTMTIDRKPVTIHYRKFDRPAVVASTLEQLVRAAMNTVAQDGTAIKQRYVHRIFTVATDNYFINTYTDRGSPEEPLVFGDILHFTKGHLQALCQTADQQAATVPVQQMKAPEQSEYVHSQMFWMLKGDHAFVIQSIEVAPFV